MMIFDVRHRLLLAALALALADSSACSREPYWLGPDDGPELPDEDPELLTRELGERGHELYIPPECGSEGLPPCPKEPDFDLGPPVDRTKIPPGGIDE